MQGLFSLHIIGWLLTALAFMGLIPALSAYYYGHDASLTVFLSTSLILSFIGGALMLTSRAQFKQLRRYDLLLLNFFIWVIIPLAAAIPIYFSLETITWSRAYMEAVSGLTTTGLTGFEIISDLPKALILWRSLLQWIGGFLTLVVLGSFIHLIYNHSPQYQGIKNQPSLERSFTLMLTQTAEMIAPLYVLGTVLCFILLIACNLPTFDALCLAFSTISTGGYMPRDGTLLSYGSDMALIVIMFFMIVGAGNYLWVITLVNKRWGAFKRDREFWFYLFICLFLTCLFVIGSSFTHNLEGERYNNNLLHSAFIAISISSTTGFYTHPQFLSFLPPAVLLAFSMVGGMRGSTSGGLKVGNVLTLYKQLFKELSWLIYPNIVRPQSSTKIADNVSHFHVIWTSFTNLLIATVISIILLGLAGMPFLGALLASIDATSNFGHFFEQSEFIFNKTYPSLSSLPAFAHYGLCFAMITGRVEIISLLALFSVVIWKR